MLGYGLISEPKFGLGVDGSGRVPNHRSALHLSTARQTPPTMSTLQRIGKYEIVRELGKGAMGTVYEGFDPGIERKVAIKTILAERGPGAAAPDDAGRYVLGTPTHMAPEQLMGQHLGVLHSRPGRVRRIPEDGQPA